MKLCNVYGEWGRASDGIKKNYCVFVWEVKERRNGIRIIKMRINNSVANRNASHVK